MKLIILGAPGAGKGSQAEKICAKYNLTHLSTGDMFRAEVKTGSELGKKLADIMQSGALVPDEVTINVLSERIKKEDCKVGFLLDGFPRTIAQAEALDKITSVDLVLNIDADFGIITERMLKRGRADDTPDTIANRLDVYQKQTAPLIDYYSKTGKLVNIEGNGLIDDIFAAVCELLDDYK
jgi:adenylate kinase